MYGDNDNGQVGGYGTDPNDTSAPAKPNVEDLLPANFPNETDQPGGGTPGPAQQSQATQDAVVPPTDVAMDGSSAGAGGGGDLLNIKQQALQQLSPLVSELDQSPEERFRTTMMMIQASDNQDLVKAAYDAAEQIGDKKEKAQALLDIVNEINYFTQQTTESGNQA
jgi:hypothetical protein